jgi:proteasome accessory factor C
MPKQELDADQLYNLALSIVGLVLKAGPSTLEDLSNHFDVSEKAVVKAIRAIANSEDQDRFETHFYVDEDALENGEVDFGLGMGVLEEPPTLSAAQMTAVAMGLEFLASLPEFTENQELRELRTALGINSAPPRGSVGRINLEVIEIIRDAIVSQSQIEFDYINQTGQRTSRFVDPLRIDLVGAKHYLRGWCHSNSEVRTFRIDRITKPKLTGASISAMAKESDIADEVYGDGQGAVIEIEAELSAQEVFWNFPTAGVLEQSDGLIRGAIKVGNTAALARHVVRYGGAVKVIAPNSARELVRKFAEAALNNDTSQESE